jgi:16S rRNA (guanine527-N7)-methyltransferase
LSRELWNSLASKAGLPLSSQKHASLDGYLDLLLSAKFNLTAITDRAEAEIQHVADALTILPHLPAAAHRLADIGSGGGVPGMILAIARPDAHVVLIESTKKKADFLIRAASELKLANIQVLPNRAEEIGRSPMRETFDIAVARAVGDLAVLAEWMLPLVKIGGDALAMKGPRVQEELPKARETIRLLGGAPAQVLPADLGQHVIIRIRKIASTNARYPRRQIHRGAAG